MNSKFSESFPRILWYRGSVKSAAEGSNFAQPAVEYLDQEIARLEMEKQNLTNIKLRGNPVQTKDIDTMLAGVDQELFHKKELRSKMIFILPEEIRRNEFGAEYAPLLCLITVDKDAAKQIRKAREELKKISIECYNNGDYGRAAAAVDIFNALEYKLPGTAGVMGAINNLTLGALDYSRAYHAAQEENAYDQYLRQMGTIHAVSTANPNAYQTGEAVMDAISLTKAGTKFAATGAFQLTDDALELAQKGVTKDFEKELYEYITGTVRDKTIEQTLSAASERLY